MADSDSDAIYNLLTSHHGTFSLAELESQFPDDLQVRLRSLADSGKMVALDDGSILSDVAWSRLETTARRTVGAYHKKHPFLLAMPIDDFAPILPKAAAYADIVPVVHRLLEKGVLVAEAKGRVRLPEHAVIMPEGWKSAAEEMLGVYATAALQPPSSYNFQSNYPRHINVRAILGILTETGALVQLEDEIYIDAATYTRVKDTVRAIAARSGGEITVGAVRDALGSTRKFVLPLLELLNAEGFTRRDGDVHFLAG